jgi:hypothetical protein
MANGEEAGSSDKVWGFINPDSALGRQIRAYDPVVGLPPDAAVKVNAPPRIPDVRGLPPTLGVNDRDRRIFKEMAENSAAQVVLDAEDGGFDFLFPTGTPPSGTQSGGPGIDMSAVRSLFALAETPEERAMLERSLEDIGQRTSAGMQALEIGWGEIVQSNQRAAERAAQMAIDAGPRAAQVWKDMARDAIELAEQRAQGLSEFAGRSRLDVDPMSGMSDFIGFMMAQAPRAMQTATQLGLISAEQIAAQSRTAGMMGQAYQADLQRTSVQLAASMAAQHNERVQNRIAQERMTLAGLESQAAIERGRLAASASDGSGLTIDTYLADIARYAGFGEEYVAGVANKYGVSPERVRAAMAQARAGQLQRERERLDLESEFAK